MNTFLPYPDYAQSAACLDNSRLGNQRKEAKQILDTLTGKSTGWWNHSATRMWRGFEPALAQYGLAICTEWTRRGFRDKQFPHFNRFLLTTDIEHRTPSWLGDWELHGAYRRALLWKGAVDVLRARCKNLFTRAPIWKPLAPRSWNAITWTQYESLRQACDVHECPAWPNWYEQWNWSESMATPDSKGSLPYKWPV